MVGFVYLIIVLMLIEGPLRKWFAPNLATPLFFMRVPFVLALYAYCFERGFLGRGQLATMWLAFAFVSTLVGGIGYAVDGITPVAWVVGAMNYWLYMPLMFVVAATFRTHDITRLTRWSLVLSIPYAALVILQYRSPPNAWINKGIAADSESVTVALDIVRPYGLFTWTTQNVDFTAFLVAAFLFFLFSAQKGRLGALVLVCAAPAIASAAVLTGSRSIYFLLGAIAIASVGGALAVGRFGAGLVRALAIAVATVLTLSLFTYQFSDMFSAVQHRFEQAERNEGATLDRAVDSLISFVEPITTGPVLGYGIGRGTPSVNGFIGERSLIFGESDLQRNINELGTLFGLLFVIMRFHIAFHIGRRALAAARRGALAALPLAGFVAVPLLASQLTHSAINGFLPWLTAGLVLAYARTATSSARVGRRLRPPQLATRRSTPSTASPERRVASASDRID